MCLGEKSVYPGKALVGSYFLSPTVLVYWLKPVTGTAVIGVAGLAAVGVGVGVTVGDAVGVGIGVTTGVVVVGETGIGGVVTTGGAAVVVTWGGGGGGAVVVEGGGATVDDVITGGLGDSDLIAGVFAGAEQPANITVIRIIPTSVEKNFLKITVLLFNKYINDIYHVIQRQ